jgi:acetylornithine deacetylase
VVSPEPASLWSREPFAPFIDGDWMYGRGAGDMKAGLAAIRGSFSGHRFEVLYDGFQCEGYELEHDAPLVTELVDACSRVTGAKPPLFASTATTDARTFQLYGDTPAVCLGPRAENEHGVDERVFLRSITQTAQAIALFISGWCGLAP